MIFSFFRKGARSIFIMYWQPEVKSSILGKLGIYVDTYVYCILNAVYCILTPHDDIVL